jgi:hypothetical protein
MVRALSALSLSSPYRAPSTTIRTFRCRWVPSEVWNGRSPPKGVGTVHEEVTTSSRMHRRSTTKVLPSCTVRVDRSRRSFNQALRFDARLAMAHVG